MSTELAALNVQINGDSADLQSDVARAKKSLATFERQVNGASAGAGRFSGSLTRLGNVSGAARAKIQNTAFQLQDIAVQLQGGTRASTVFAQQLPQLFGGLGTLGAVVGVLAAVGIPSLAFAFNSLGADTIDLEEELDGLEDRMDAVNRASKVLQLSADDTAEKFGALAGAARLASLAIIENEVELARRDLAGLSSDLADVASKYKALGQMNSATNRQMRRELGITVAQQRELNAAIDAVRNAEGFEAQIASMLALRDLMQSMGIDTQELSDEFLEAESRLNQAQLRALELRNALDEAATSAANVTSNLSDLGGVGAQIAATGRLSDMLSTADDPESPGRPSRPDTTRNLLETQLEQVRKAILTQEELQIASFERQQEVLNAALQKQLLTRQEFNELIEDAQKAHADKMAQLAVYKHGDTLQKTGAFMGDMAAAMSSGNDKMLRAARAFGAAEALVNAYRAYSQVIADPTVPFFAKIPAAMSVLSAGLGAVNAIKSGGGGGGAPSVAAQAAPAQIQRNVTVQLTGGNSFTGDILELIERLNEAIGDGANLRVTQ